MPYKFCGKQKGQKEQDDLCLFARWLVGVDAHIDPAVQSVFTVFFGEFATSQQADVGIGPYKRMRKCIQICRKHNFRR